MHQRKATQLLKALPLLAVLCFASATWASPPDWMQRNGTIGNALKQSDNSSVALDCVVIDKIKAKQRIGYFVIRECFSYKDRVVVLTPPNQALRLGMNVDVSGTLVTLPNGCRAIVSPTVMGYTDEDGVLLTRGGPFIKGLRQPTPWNYKVDLTVSQETGTMSSMSTSETISPNDDEPNATPAEGTSYYATVAEILEGQSGTQTSGGISTQSYYDGIPEIRGLPDGSLVELQCKGITAVGTENINGTDYNYLDLIENPPATDTIRAYYSGTAAVTDRVNKIFGQIRHVGTEPVICTDSGPGYDPQILEGGCQLVAQGTIAWAKTFPDGTQLPAQLQAKVVSGSFGDFGYGHFFIQEPSRASGIRVNPTDYYWYTETGYPVTITSAQVTTINNQRALAVSSEDIENDWENWTAVNPLGMNNKWVAGGPFNVYTPGATDAFGLNNVGLLIKTWGLASNVQPGYFYINDGSDNVGVKVDVDQGGYYIYHNVQTGDYAAVTGIAQLETVSDQKMRVIKPRYESDIQVILSAPHFNNITATPSHAGIGDEVTISFTVSTTLSANPSVTVNGHTATYYSGGGYYWYPYTYKYTIQESDPVGWATIAISGSNGLPGSASSSTALRIDSSDFDEDGHRTVVKDSRGVTRYEYDILGRLVKVTEPDGKWIAYEYDLNNNRTRMTVRLSDDPLVEHVTQYQYNDSSRLSKVIDHLSRETTYTYKDNGLVDTITYPNGTKAIHSYNSRNLLTSVSNQKSDGTIIAQFDYTYDSNSPWGKNGTRTRVIENILKPDGNRINAQIDYEYDDLYRLVYEHRTAYNGGNPGATYEYNFSYDAAGNRTSWQVVGGTTTNYSYDDANRMTTAGSASFTYDDAGNMTTESNGGTVTYYTWDYRNLMTRYQVGSTTVDYAYDGFGARVERRTGSTVTRFMMDDAQVAEELDATGSPVVSYVATPGGMLYAISSNGTDYYSSDALGTVHATTDTTGAVSSVFVPDAYGRMVVSEGNANPNWRYIGKLGYNSDSDTGLCLLTLRYYNPAVGRFLSRDPAVYGSNYYEYVRSNPVSYVDPTGLFAVPSGGIGSIGGGGCYNIAGPWQICISGSIDRACCCDSNGNRKCGTFFTLCGGLGYGIGDGGGGPRRGGGNIGGGGGALFNCDSMSDVSGPSICLACGISGGMWGFGCSVCVALTSGWPPPINVSCGFGRDIGGPPSKIGGNCNLGGCWSKQL